MAATSKSPGSFNIFAWETPLTVNLPNGNWPITSNIRELILSSSGLVQLAHDSDVDLVWDGFNNDRLVIKRGQITLTQPLQTAGKVVRALEAICRHENLARLGSTESAQVDQINFTLRHYHSGVDSIAMRVIERVDDRSYQLVFDETDDANNQYVIELTNNADSLRYVYVLYLDAEYGITQFFPTQGENVALVPRQPHLVGVKQASGHILKISLPNFPRWDSSTESIKIISAPSPLQLNSLTQDGISVPSMHVPWHRDGVESPVPADLAVTTINVQVTRSLGKIALSKGLTHVVSDGFEITKPTDVVGEIHIQPFLLGTRSANTGLSILTRHPHRFRLPKIFGNHSLTRSISSETLAFDITLPEDSRKQINPQTPLIIHSDVFSGEANAVWVAIVNDGEDELVVGYSEKGESALRIDVVPVGSAEKRTLAKTVRCFAMQLIGMHSSQPELRRVFWQNDKIHYSTIDTDLIRPGERVAILVHGFLSDTASLVRHWCSKLQGLSIQYDHWLAFDCETITRSVDVNGSDLANMLGNICGFANDDGIQVDIFAHSMGALIARTAIERYGAEYVVDRLIMAGAPNRGTKLASFARSGLLVASQALDIADRVVDSSQGLGVIDLVLQQALDRSPGWADIGEDSAFTQQLNAGKLPQMTRYLSLVGENNMDAGIRNAFNRQALKLIDQTIDQALGEENDGIIGKSSMCHFGQRYVDSDLQPTIVLTTSHHFNYFADPDVLPQLQEFLR